MTQEMLDKVKAIITANILTPVVYFIENEDTLEFICFCDRHITMQEIYNVEQMIKSVTGQNAEIIDIREFSESERLEVIHNAELIHSEHPIIEYVFAQSMVEDYRVAMEQRRSMLDRQRETGTFYLQ